MNISKPNLFISKDEIFNYYNKIPTSLSNVKCDVCNEPISNQQKICKVIKKETTPEGSQSSIVLSKVCCCSCAWWIS